MFEIGIFLAGAVIGAVVSHFVRRNNTEKFDAVMNRVDAMVDYVDERLDFVDDKR